MSAITPEKFARKNAEVDEWAHRITRQHEACIASIVETGKLLIRAKADLGHGRFSLMFDKRLVPFSQQTANKLMAIAEHPSLSNPAHVRNLPSAWSTLYELTRLPEPALTAAFSDGRITPELRREAATAMVRVEQQRAEVRHQEATPVVADDGEDVTDDDTPPSRIARWNGVPSKQLGPPRQGMQFARLAIWKLEEIRDDDTERQQAFDQVRSWLNDQAPPEARTKADYDLRCVRGAARAMAFILAAAKSINNGDVPTRIPDDAILEIEEWMNVFSDVAEAPDV